MLAESGLISVSRMFYRLICRYIWSVMLIIKLLNTVWQGAVQTDTLSAFFSLKPILTGFLITIIIASDFSMSQNQASSEESEQGIRD